MEHIISEVIATELALKLNGASIDLKLHTPAHTDGDLAVRAVRVVEVPVRVNQVRNRLGSQSRKSRGDLHTRYANACVNENFAVWLREEGDIASGGLKHPDVIPEPVGHNGATATLSLIRLTARLRERLFRRSQALVAA